MPGKVTSHKGGLWRVEYEDGDEEDMDESELNAVLVSKKAKKGQHGGRVSVM